MRIDEGLLLSSPESIHYILRPSVLDGTVSLFCINIFIRAYSSIHVEICKLHTQTNTYTCAYNIYVYIYECERVHIYILYICVERDTYLRDIII